jgi:hypothetical protein
MPFEMACSWKVIDLTLMSDCSPENRQVFEFSHDQTDFSMTDEFKSDLKSANSPFLIVLVGNGRAGKSTRANQLVKHELEPDGPFVADSGMDPVTMGFQYVGPFKFGTLAQIHGIELNVDGDPDVFLIDCEGLHSLGEATPALKKATFALSQLASITLLVMGEPVNHQNIDHVRALLLLSHAFSRDLPGFANGTTIMMREIGVPSEKGRKQSIEELDEKRKHSDDEQRVKIIHLLDEANVHCTPETLLVLAQPQLYRQTELYWKSIQDFLKFAAIIASLRENITGSSLIDLFMEAKPLIMQVEDFANPSLPFDQVLDKITNDYLETAYNHAIHIVDDKIGKLIDIINSIELRNGLHVDFIAKQIEFAMHLFKETAERRLPHLLDYAPAKTHAFQERVKNDVQTSCNNRFLERCSAVLLPELQIEIIEQAKVEIQAEIEKLTPLEVAVFSFTKLSNQYETTCTSRFEQVVSKIHPEIVTSSGFQSLTCQLRTRISEYVLEVETVQRREHAKYVQEESERNRKEQEAKFLEEVDRIGREAAEKQREDDDKRFEAFKKETEENTRRKMEFEQNMAALKALQEMQEKQEKSLQEMREKQRRKSEKMKKKLADQQRESEEKAEQQRQTEARIREAKERELEAMIRQREADTGRITRENEYQARIAKMKKKAAVAAVTAAEREKKEKECQDRIAKLEKNAADAKAAQEKKKCSVA